MEELYGLHCTSVSDYSMLLVPETDYNINSNNINMIPPPPPPVAEISNTNNYHGGFPTSFQAVLGSYSCAEQLLSGNSSAVSDAASMVPQKGGSEEEVSSAIRAKIASHPVYPNLLHAYIDCQKVGAPPEMACMLDQIRQESELSRGSTAANSSCLGVDPELDEFMESYCDILVRYKTDLSRPFDEATTYLNDIQAQFNSLCNGASTTTTTHVPDELVCSSDEDVSGGDVECARMNEDRELKDKLLRKYSGYISTLKHEFSKKKKKGKLPKEARQVLLNWWNVHYKWPYPTEADKVALADTTGLDQKQINNWFINQRKRHWKPTENMQFAVVDSLYGSLFMSD